MDVTQILDQDWLVIQSAPLLCILLVVIGGIVGWLLKSSLSRAEIETPSPPPVAEDKRKVLIEERLAAVMRNEDMLKVQVAALREHFQIVESQVLHEGRVPALIAATGSTASTITNIALTTEALDGSLTGLRLGVGGTNGWLHTAPVTEKPEVVAAV